MSYSGLCPSKDYVDLPNVHLDFPNYDDDQKYRYGKIKEEEVKVEHRIDVPKSLLQRMNAIYEVQKNPNDEVMNGLLKGFFDQRNKQENQTK